MLATCSALLLGATLASAQAPDTKEMTKITFSAPVALPGVTLPAGTYMFQLADSQVNRNIVQVFDQDRTKIIATILAIPAERTRPADDTVITFKETPANTAPAIQYWYYPGNTRGQEFAYPKSQAQQIANATHNSVLSIDTDETGPDAMKNGKISRVEPEANTESAAQSALASPTPATPEQPKDQPNAAMTPQSSPQPAQPEPSAAAQTAPQPAPTPAAEPSTPSPNTERTPATSAQSTTQAPAPRASTTPSTQGAVGTSGTRSANLPKTASSAPLVGFVGLLALATAFGVRALRRTEV
jgi:hypothetical protein